MTGFYAGLGGIAALVLVLWLLGLVGTTRHSRAAAHLNSQILLPPVQRDRDVVRADHTVPPAAVTPVWDGHTQQVDNVIVNPRYPQMNR